MSVERGGVQLEDMSLSVGFSGVLVSSFSLRFCVIQHLPSFSLAIV